MDNNTNTVVNTIKVGFKNYRIERPDDIEEVAGEYYGTANFDKGVIQIANKFEQSNKNHTFIHEMMHCICRRFDLKALNGDEHSIELLSIGIYEAIIDNPHIFKMADI